MGSGDGCVALGVSAARAIAVQVLMRPMSCVSVLTWSISRVRAPARGRYTCCHGLHSRQLLAQRRLLRAVACTRVPARWTMLSFVLSSEPNLDLRCNSQARQRLKAQFGSAAAIPCALNASQAL